MLFPLIATEALTIELLEGCSPAADQHTVSAITQARMLIRRAAISPNK
jgi:hypothetical protein